MPNRLINATSPYLLQHAHNPVDWYAWGEEALQTAKKKDKPILVSIGYSACHWCHVMERESFENEAIAEIMNRHFVCIKIDREERPDVDAIYMDAVQAMGTQGGWPLNVFLTPNAHPFYGGTYFPPQYWADLLEKIAQVFKDNRAELEKSAEQFRDAIAKSEIQKYGLNEQYADFRAEDLDTMFIKLSKDFDTQRGGIQKAPKFPMPSIWAFLLHYSHTTKHAEYKAEALNQLKLTLTEIAKGGIYDQIGGGFARYSVDGDWFAPHFEKMLYDNGQLVSLYAQAYSATQDELYKKTVYETIRFTVRELTSPEGGFYAALDADSAGMEGKYYVWTHAEIEQILADEAERQLFCAYYNTSSEGNWEHGYNILHRRLSDSEFAQKHALSLEALEEKVKQWKQTVHQSQVKRIRPGLDDKILTAWNALMLKGLADAYRVFGEAEFLDMAVENAYFLKHNLWNGTHLYRTYKNGQASLMGYLEDYATLIEAFITLYLANFDKQWLEFAKTLTDYTIENFYDTEEGLFFFTDRQGEALIARKKEIFDNVIPASNSIMARNLQLLGLFYAEERYTTIAAQMLTQVRRILLQNAEYLANWAQVYALLTQPIAEVVIVGEDYQFFRETFEKVYHPAKILTGSPVPSDALPLLEYRGLRNDLTTIYVCFNRTCQLPVNTVEEAWAMIRDE
jgi:hypothetical protein